MEFRISFQQSEDARFLVLYEQLHPRETSGEIALAVFDDGDDFIHQIIFAELSQEATTSLIAGVLLAASATTPRAPWIRLELNARQQKILKLTPALAPVPDGLNLASMILHSPIPLTLMLGPEHRFTFINQAYANLMQRPQISDVLGRTVREVLPELEGAGFFQHLDNVYRTGELHTGREVPALLRDEATGKMRQHYFNFIYHPVRDSEGSVRGILAQANDVTTAVFEQTVSEARETTLFKQWAELETIYRYSPMALCLLDPQDYRILKLNDLTAELLGAPRAQLLGRDITAFLQELPEFENEMTKICESAKAAR